MQKSILGRVTALLMVAVMVLAGISPTSISPPAQAQMLIQQGSTARKIEFVMYATGTSTATAGLSVTVTVSKNGTTFAAGGGTVAEVGNGVYSYAPSAGDTTGVFGSFMIRATATGADPTIKEVQTVAWNPDATDLGIPALATLLTRIPQAFSFTSGNVNSAAQNLPSTYPLLANDETTLAALFNMITGSGVNAKFTAGALSNGPTGSGSDPFGLAKGSYGAGTWGNFLATQLDTNIGSRMGTFTLPNNFSMLNIDSGGKVGLQAAEYTAITNALLNATVNGHTVKSIFAANGMSLTGTITSYVRNSSAKTITITYTDGPMTGTYVQSFNDTALTLPAGRTVSVTGGP